MQIHSNATEVDCHRTRLVIGLTIFLKEIFNQQKIFFIKKSS